MLAQKLESIGLSDKEAKVYLALLEMGKATAQDLAEKSGINRGTTYSVLDSLHKKRLVQEKEKSGVSYFLSTGADNLKKLLETEKQLIDQKISSLEDFFPEIDMLSNLTGERTNAKFIKGLEGIEYLRKRMQKVIRKQDVYNIFHANIAWDLFPVKRNDYRQKWQKYPLKIKALAVYNASQGLPEKRVSYKGAEIRYISQTKLPFFCEMLITNNWFSIFDYQDDFTGLVVEHQNIVNAMRSLFSLGWEAAEEYAHLIEKA